MQMTAKKRDDLRRLQKQLSFSFQDSSSVPGHVEGTNLFLVVWAAKCQLETAYGSCLVRPKVTQAG